MPEIKNENIKLREIEELEKQLAERKAAFEKEGRRIEAAGKIEITKENAPEKPWQATPAQPAVATVAIDEEKARLEEIKRDVKKIKNLDTARQVKVLVTLAFEKGIAHSIKVARSLNDAYLLDQLHDELIGELREELVKKGRLKEI